MPALYKRKNPLAIELLAKMLVYSPATRMSARETLQQPFFSSLYNKYYGRSTEFALPMPKGMTVPSKARESVEIKDLVVDWRNSVASMTA